MKLPMSSPVMLSLFVIATGLTIASMVEPWFGINYGKNSIVLKFEGSTGEIDSFFASFNTTSDSTLVSECEFIPIFPLLEDIISAIADDLDFLDFPHWVQELEDEFSGFFELFEIAEKILEHIYLLFAWCPLFCTFAVFSGWVSTAWIPFHVSTHNLALIIASLTFHSLGCLLNFGELLVTIAKKMPLLDITISYKSGYYLMLFAHLMIFIALFVMIIDIFAPPTISPKLHMRNTDEQEDVEIMTKS